MKKLYFLICLGFAGLIIFIDLDKLAHYNEKPLSSIIIEIDEFDKKNISWIKKDEESGGFLLRAIDLIKNEISKEYYKGYFEGIITISKK